MAIPFFRSLRARIVVALALVLSLVLGVLLVNSARIVATATERSSAETREQLALLINAALAPYATTGQLERFGAFFAESMGGEAEGVTYLRIIDSRGRQLLSVGEPPAPGSRSPGWLDALVPPPSLDPVRRPVLLERNEVGAIEFGLSQTALARAREQVLLQGALLSLAAVAFAAILITLVGYWLFRRLGIVLRTTQSIAAGDYSVAVPETGNDEFAALGRSINAMRLAVQMRVRELAESEARYRALAERSPLGILVHVRGTVRYANPAMLTLLGLRDLAGIVGRDFLDFVAAPWRDSVRARIETMSNAGGFAPFLHRQLLRADGTPIDVEMGGVSVGEGDEKPVQVLVLDVSERRRNEEALRASEQRLLATIENTPDVAVQWFDRQGRVVFWNRASETLFGLPASGTIGKTFAELGLTSPQDLAAFLEAIEWVEANGRPTPAAEFTVRRPDGVVKTTLSTIFAIPGDRGENQYVCMDVDVTARKEAEAKLRTLATELERKVEERTRELAEANRELEAFSYSVSHDLRGPLRHVDGFTAMLADELGPAATADARSYMERIRTSVQRMAALIEDLLELARISRIALARTRVDISALAHEIASELGREDRAREVEWRVEPGLFADADPGLARIALENLLGNAWKYTGRTARARIEVVRDDDPGEGFDFVVRDNGAGFDMAHSAMLFKPFHRLHADDEFKGTGIGLATVHRIVQRHGGCIRGAGEPGRGAQFRIRLTARGTLGTA